MKKDVKEEVFEDDESDFGEDYDDSDSDDKDDDFSDTKVVKLKIKQTKKINADSDHSSSKNCNKKHGLSHHHSLFNLS